MTVVVWIYFGVIAALILLFVLAVIRGVKRAKAQQ